MCAGITGKPLSCPPFPSVESPFPIHADGILFSTSLNILLHRERALRLTHQGVSLSAVLLCLFQHGMRTDPLELTIPPSTPTPTSLVRGY